MWYLIILLTALIIWMVSVFLLRSVIRDIFEHYPWISGIQAIIIAPVMVTIILKEAKKEREFTKILSRLIVLNRCLN